MCSTHTCDLQAASFELSRSFISIFRCTKYTPASRFLEPSTKLNLFKIASIYLLYALYAILFDFIKSFVASLYVYISITTYCKQSEFSAAEQCLLIMLLSLFYNKWKAKCFRKIDINNFVENDIIRRDSNVLDEVCEKFDLFTKGRIHRQRFSGIAVRDICYHATLLYWKTSVAMKHEKSLDFVSEILDADFDRPRDLMVKIFLSIKDYRRKNAILDELKGLLFLRSQVFELITCLAWQTHQP